MVKIVKSEKVIKFVNMLYMLENNWDQKNIKEI